MSKVPMPRRDRVGFFLAAALLAFVVLLYLPSLDFPFLQVDDNPHLLQQDLRQVPVSWAFQNSFAWQPLTWLSHRLDFILFGFQNARPHHLVSLLLHVANAGLLIWFVLKLTGDLILGLSAAALFALHPLRVESVDWISGRGDLLAGFLVLLALEAHRRQRWWAVASLGVLAMMASPAAALFGLVILLLDVVVLLRPVEWRECGPLLAAGAMALYLRAAGGPDHVILLPGSPRASFIGGLTIFAGQLAATIWPAGLAIARPAVAFAVPTLASRPLPTSAPLIKFGAGAFVLFILPSLFLPSVWGRADHTTYVPHLALMVAVAAAIPAAPRGAVVGVLSALLAVATWVHQPHFQGTIPLLQHSVEINPVNTEARLGLGLALAGQGQVAAAEPHLRQVTKERPDSVDAWVGYGRALTSQKKATEALAAMTEAVRQLPKAGEVTFELGIAQQNMNQVDEAERSFAAALRQGLDARTGAIAYNNLGSYAARRGELPQAEKFFEQAWTLDIGFALAHRNYAMTLVAQKQKQKAISHLEKKAILWTRNDRLVGEYLSALMNEAYAEQFKKQQEQMMREQELERKAQEARQKK